MFRMEHNQAQGFVRAFGGKDQEIPKPPPSPPGLIDDIIDIVGGFIESNQTISVGGAVAAVGAILYRRRRRKIQPETDQATPDKPLDRPSHRRRDRRSEPPLSE